MTNRELEAVAGVFMTADGGCMYCAKALFREFFHKLPELKEAMNDVLRARSDEDSADVLKMLEGRGD